MSNTVARIESLEADSPADRAGIKAGECVHSVNGQVISDYIDWLWESDSTELELEITDRQGKTRPVILQRDSLQEGWGISFDELVFDAVHTCENDCVFCFMRQLPATARKTLCMRDDDYRLSFLQGNFITLTNLTAEDKQRIIEQRISPLRLSLHAVSDEVRQQLIGKNHAVALENLDELIAAGIDFHIQIVLVPGINDGEELERTLAYLKDAKRLPHIVSVGIVPLAFTDFAQAKLKELLNSASMVPADREIWAKSVIDQVQKHQFKEFEERELTWVYLADEFYIHAHAPFPLAEFYDGFPQLENGIGMVLDFVEDIRDSLNELQAALGKLPQNGPGTETVTIVCGELLTQTWLGVLGGIHAGGKLRLLPVKNRFFGGNVSVTGLLAGSDLLRALKLDYDYLRNEGHAGLDRHLYVIPDCIFNDDGISLDDLDAQHLIAEAAKLGVSIQFYAANAAGLVAALDAHVSVVADTAALAAAADVSTEEA